MIGGMYGTYRVDQDMVTRDYIISRHEPDDRIHYVDPDREYLFDRNSDGTLTRNEAVFKK